MDLRYYWETASRELTVAIEQSNNNIRIFVFSRMAYEGTRTMTSSAIVPLDYDEQVCEYATLELNTFCSIGSCHKELNDETGTLHLLELNEKER